MVLPAGEGFQQGMMSERYANDFWRNREQKAAAQNVAEWQRYSAYLEHCLAKAQAERYAALYRSNVFAAQLDQLQAEIRRLDPMNSLGGEVALNRAARERIDSHLASKGLQIDRSNPEVFAVKGRLR